MSVNIISADGTIVNVTTERKFLQPCVECLEITTPKKGSIKRKWESILERVEDTSIYSTKSAILHTEDGHADIIVVSGSGVYRDKPSGKSKITFTYDESVHSMYPRTLWVDEDGKQVNVKPYHLLLFTLYPAICRRYLESKSLEVNHTIIPARGIQSNDTAVEFYEVISKGRNLEHGSFVRRYNLYGAPVSAFDFDKLKTLYDYNNIADIKVDEEFVPRVTIEEMLKDKQTYRAAYRRTLTWLYYLYNHTDNNDIVWMSFKKYLEDEYDVKWTGSMDSLRDYFSRQIKLAH